MDECRFDNWTRLLGGLQDRRAALRELAGAGTALLALARVDLGFAAEDDVLIEGCRLSGEGCSKNKQCCSDKCNRHRKKKKKKNNDNVNNGHHHHKNKKKNDGECQCLDNGKSCRKDAACCRGFCDKNSFECRCVPSNDSCHTDNDCCKGNCVTDNQGNKFCKANGK